MPDASCGRSYMHVRRTNAHFKILYYQGRLLYVLQTESELASEKLYRYLIVLDRDLPLAVSDGFFLSLSP